MDCYQKQDVGCAFTLLKAGITVTLSAIFPMGFSLTLEEHKQRENKFMENKIPQIQHASIFMKSKEFQLRGSHI